MSDEITNGNKGPTWKWMTGGALAIICPLLTLLAILVGNWSAQVTDNQKDTTASIKAIDSSVRNYEIRLTRLEEQNRIALEYNKDISERVKRLESRTR